MKEESDTSNNDVLERLTSCPIILPHNVMLSKQDSSPPHASSSPSSTSVSSITSISKVSSSTNGNGAALPNGVPVNPNLEELTLRAAQFEFAMKLGFPQAFMPEHQQLIMSVARSLSCANSTSSDGSNNGSPISSFSLPSKLHSTGSSKSKKGAGKGASGGESLSGAVASSTGNREKVFVCQTCDRSFGYKHVLQNHERTHTGEKPFECRECHKRFTRDHHLKTHMRLHTGEKPYHCEHCDRQFVQVANLRRHLRVHTGEKPYACELCTSRFSDSNQLKAHMLIHKGEKPFECAKCDGRFRRRHHLIHHKCPKDEANVGKPRRGRRPKAYEQLQSSGSPNSLSSRPASVDESVPPFPMLSLSAAATVTSTTPNASNNNLTVHNSGRHMSHHHLAQHLISGNTANLTGTSHFEDLMPKSRRKPRHTNRIVPSLGQSMFDELHDPQDEGDVQTQPLNLVLNRRSFNDDVLDLSRSRSDAESEPEPIEEDEEEDEVVIKQEHQDDEDLVMMQHHPKHYLGNGHKAHSFNNNKPYSSNHINNNNHCSNKSLFASKLHTSKTLLDNGNSLTALDLAFDLGPLKSFKSKSVNGLPVPLPKSRNQSKVSAQSMVTE